MHQVLLVIEIFVTLFMTLFILLQHRASGLSATFGGTGATYIQRRGAERVLFTATIWLSAAFLGIAALLMYI